MARLVLPDGVLKGSSAERTCHCACDAGPWRDRGCRRAGARAGPPLDRRDIDARSRRAGTALAVPVERGRTLLAAAAGERRQVAVRRALGAGRELLAARRLFEGLLIGAAASAGALALYAWARVEMAEVALQPTLSLRLDLPLDPPIVTALLLGEPVAGLLLALGPAVWTTRFDLAAALGDGSHRAGDSTGRTRRALVGRRSRCRSSRSWRGPLHAHGHGAVVGRPVLRAGLAARTSIWSRPVRHHGWGCLAREALARVWTVPGIAAAAFARARRWTGPRRRVTRRAGDTTARRGHLPRSDRRLLRDGGHSRGRRPRVRGGGGPPARPWRS